MYYIFLTIKAIWSLCNLLLFWKAVAGFGYSFKTSPDPLKYNKAKDKNKLTIKIFFCMNFVFFIISCAILDLFSIIYFLIMFGYEFVLYKIINFRIKKLQEKYDKVILKSQNYTPAEVAAAKPVTYDTHADWLCPKCGRNNTPNDRFCKDCGTYR